jgi:hypothetical protein
LLEVQVKVQAGPDRQLLPVPLAPLAMKLSFHGSIGAPPAEKNRIIYNGL